MADNLAPDDKGNPAQAGGVNNTFNTYPSTGGGAPVIASPTTVAGTVGTPAAKINKNAPGKRIQNPLGNFSSYTYQISLYMITPDAYDAFIQSGRKDINAINNIVPGANTPEATTAEDTRESQRFSNASNRGNTTSPPAPSSANASSTQYTNGVYLIAQSGGINNNTQKRAPGFDLDYYIDDLVITQAINGKDTLSSTNTTDIRFTITEPYGFSFITKLRNAATELAKVSRSKNYKDIKNPSRQFFMLGIRFLGYDKDGYLIDPTKIPSSDGNPQGNAFGLYERFYDIFITGMKFRIEGKAVIYNITAASVATGAAFGTKRGFVDTGASVLGATVYDALMGSSAAGTNPGESASTTPPQGGTIGLLAKLNKDQQTLLKNKSIEIANEWDVVFLGVADLLIKKASIVDKAVLDKRMWAMANNIKKSSDSNVATEANSNPKNDARQITFTKGGSILQCVNQIILQSDYLLNALKIAYLSTTEPDDNGKYPEKNNPQEVKIQWYTMHAEVKNLGWDTLQQDFAYKTTFTIQPYETPVVVAPYVKPGSAYYGPHKRYEYWFTGKNSEIISYEQQMDNTYFNVAVSAKDNISGVYTETSTVALKEGGQPDQGALGMGLQAQNAYMTSLYDPGAYATAKIKLLGDPDFLMQSAPSSINSFYDQFYGTDGYTINPNGGQVFIEINFKEPKDYQNSTGLLSINQSIYFWEYPAVIQKQLDDRGGGVSYMVRTVVSTFSKGKFEQELTCGINTFANNQIDSAAAAAAGRDQTIAISARTGVALTPEAAATARAAFADTDSRQVNGPATSANGSASVPSSTATINPLDASNSVVQATARLIENQTLIQNGVQDDDAGQIGPR
jgi:hypothetical protein